MTEGSALGEQAKAIMAEGGMVPTTLILDLLLAAMATPYSQEEEEGAATRSFLVDGFPRKLDQLQEFEAKVSSVRMCGEVRKQSPSLPCWPQPAQLYYSVIVH